MPPPAKNFFNLVQVTQLQQALKRERATVRERILIILLKTMAGRNKKFLISGLFSPRTVTHGAHGEPDNLESLHNKREREHYRKATPEYIELLLKTVDKTPRFRL